MLLACWLEVLPMDVRDLVRKHYGGGDLAQAIISALAAAGVNTDDLTAESLLPLDQLHAGGRPATEEVLKRLAPGEDTRLLDVGCGIGGPARLAATYGATVTGVDLTPEFVAAATTLSDRVGLSDRAQFVPTDGEELPFHPGDFNAAMMMHVGMNVPDKPALFAEVHRVLEPGAAFLLYEQVRARAGDLPYPMPWADDERTSFVETRADYTGHLESAGFTVEQTEDLGEFAQSPPPPGPLSPTVVLGEAFAERVGNNVAAHRAGLLQAVVITARA
jgi:ubiquinone/menaquinone biosynthesis C-methylase UbiE